MDMDLGDSLGILGIVGMNKFTSYCLHYVPTVSSYVPQRCTIIIISFRGNVVAFA